MVSPVDIKSDYSDFIFELRFGNRILSKDVCIGIDWSFSYNYWWMQEKGLVKYM